MERQLRLATSALPNASSKIRHERRRNDAGRIALASIDLNPRSLGLQAEKSIEKRLLRTNHE